ncbi:hypothetical protein [Acuticoccus sp.]|uniref:hypothetical protein n=1 Tax=Acuticoccus sp. TaxID=1904378 RepID=UPI003B5215A3
MTVSRGAALAVLACGLGGALGACQSSRPADVPVASVEPPAASVRQSGTTAPADLQLLCASQAASELGAAGEVLPVASTLTPSGAYAVELSVDGGRATCLVREDGTVEEIARA